MGLPYCEAGKLTHWYLSFEISSEKLGRYELSDIGQISVDLFQATDNASCSEIHRVINCILNTEKLPELVRRVKKLDYRNYRGVSVINCTQKFI